MENYPIYQQVSLRPEKLIDPKNLRHQINGKQPILLLLAAGKGTRFGKEPKCIQSVCGTPLAKHSIEAFRKGNPNASVIGIVGYKSEEVSQALGDDNIYVLSDNPTGGTAWAVYEAFCVSGLLEKNPIIVISMGDRIVPSKTFQSIINLHCGQTDNKANPDFDELIKDEKANNSNLPQKESHLDKKQPKEADLTLLTAHYEYPRNRGKGRIIRDRKQNIVKIIEENDIIEYFNDFLKNQRQKELKLSAFDLFSKEPQSDLSNEQAATKIESESSFSQTNDNISLQTSQQEKPNDDELNSENRAEDQLVTNALLSLTEGNCPLYVIRARTLMKHLMFLSNNNTQNQFYLTDIIERIAQEGGVIRSLTVRPNDQEYSILCADVTRAENLDELKSVFDQYNQTEKEIHEAATVIRSNRPIGQTLSICRQLRELWQTAQIEKQNFNFDQPFSIGISGGRLRIAFMHPDMGRFLGPAWQTPIGAKDEKGSEQIVVLIQETDDHRVHLFPIDPQFRETIDSIESDNEIMYPDEKIRDWYSYEEFGAKMSETLLLSLGYFSDLELEMRRQKSIPLPPESLWVSNNMRRPFSLIGNVIASLRTCREGSAGDKIQQKLGKNRFLGLRIMSSGAIPQGGFSSSSAVTIAMKNGLNALFGFGLTNDQLIHLACQAEYGTGVRAGSLDQATVQKGQVGKGTLLSSNSRDNYAILGTYPIPSHRYQVIFPYSAERDSVAFRWSGGFYSDNVRAKSPAILTTTEFRKMTGKAAEIAAILLQIPLDLDLFQEIQNDLLNNGVLNIENQQKIKNYLLKLPLWISKAELQKQILSNSSFYQSELKRCFGCSDAEAVQRSQSTFASLFQGWREPIFRSPELKNIMGVPLRSMIAYLYAEVAKNFYLMNHPDSWIEMITLSQRGDCCFEIDPQKLPSKNDLLRELPWEKNTKKENRLNLWLKNMEARPFDFCCGLDDESLLKADKIEFHRLKGTNFFRGLALIDLAEAMLKRAFGENAVAVRVNAAGQGDYFQVHIDTEKVSSEEVRNFLRQAYYERFQIVREKEFIETYPGGGAAAVRLTRFSLLPQLIETLSKNC